MEVAATLCATVIRAFPKLYREFERLLELSIVGGGLLSFGRVSPSPGELTDCLADLESG